MNTKAVLGLTAGALVVGLLAGLTIGNNGDKATTAVGPGPSKTVAGVPVGYQHSREGAVKAALEYESVLAQLTKMSKESRSAAISEIAVVANRDAIVSAADKSLSFYDQQFGQPGVVRTTVVGFRVQTYETNTADVELWEVSVVGRPEAIPARSAWSTRRLSLRWEDDWKLATPPADSVGPTPALDGTPSDSATVITAARDLSEVGYVPR